MGQFAKLSQDEVRDKKKQAKKELLERSKEDVTKVIQMRISETCIVFTRILSFRWLMSWL